MKNSPKIGRALEQPRIRGDWGFAAFREVAPALGVREVLKYTFRGLAHDLPALSTPSARALPLPSEDLCRETWDLWHRLDGDRPVYAWPSDTFESRFLGELYQDLDAEVRKRFALLQTPPFVEKYILDHTLTPALVEFDPAKLRAAGDALRLIDPTCGSGHFLSAPSIASGSTGRRTASRTPGRHLTWRSRASLVATLIPMPSTSLASA